MKTFSKIKKMFQFLILFFHTLFSPLVSSFETSSLIMKTLQITKNKDGGGTK